MTKADIIDVVSGGTGLTKVETAAVIDGFLATVSYSLQHGERVELRGFGTFLVRERKAKEVPNPRTGEMMHIPHRVVPDFKPSATLKEMVAKTMIETGQFEPEPEEDESQTDMYSDLDRFFMEE